MNIGKSLRNGKMRIHRNDWIWGKTWVIVCDDGSGIIKISQDEDNGVTYAFIYSAAWVDGIGE